MSWKLLGKKTVLNTYKTAIQSWRIRLPNGKARDFFISAGYSYVVVLAVDVKGRVVILKQHYISQQKKLVSLVAGIIDDNEQPKATAPRELLEETGYTAKQFISLGKSIKGKYSTGEVHHFLALDASKVEEPKLEDAEDIEILIISMPQFKKLLKQRKLLNEAFMEVCAYRALAYLDNLKNNKKR